MINKERITTTFLELVKIDSVSGREEEVKKYITKKFEDLGLEVEEDHASSIIGGQCGNLIARLKGEKNAPCILLCSHMDTVEPGSGVIPVIEGDIVRSSGDTILGSDDKAGIAAIIEVLTVIKENNLIHPPIEIFLTVSEEQGLMGSRYLDHTKITAQMGYVLDSAGPPGTIIIQGPTQNELQIEVKGKAAHAGINPEDGINAIVLAAHAISHLHIGRIDEETTCNLGTIQGGIARNIVPENVVLKGETRSQNQDKLNRITELIKSTFEEKVKEKGGTCTVTVNHLYPNFKLSEDEPVVKIAVKAAESMGWKPVITCSGGGSDANHLNHYGIRCVNLGIGMRDVHTTSEHISIEDLVNNARYLLRILEEVVG